MGSELHVPLSRIELLHRPNNWNPKSSEKTSQRPRKELEMEKEE
jgi:hypothetical protein